MRFSKLLLTSTTALGLSMTAVFADNNVSSLSQAGTDNDARIVQSGSSNYAGTDNGNNASESVLQTGNNNNLDITQSGDGNQTGVDGASTKVASVFRQSGDNNDMELTQSGDGNNVRDVIQNAVDPAADTNNGVIEQSSNGNTIISFSQIFRGAGAANNADVLQTAGDSNRANFIAQRGFNNNLTIEQTGSTNLIKNAKQLGIGLGPASNGSGNTGQIVMSGDNNGRGALTDDYSGATAAEASNFLQGGMDNSATLDFAGNDNDFGVTQNGERNQANGIIVTGDFNSVGVGQIGNDNRIALTTVTGNDNSIGFNQNGNNNFGSADITGDSNSARIAQIGDDNNTTLWVSTSFNTAMLDVTGNNNVLNAQQRFGGNNAMTVDVYGSNNNNISPTSFFTGDALSARNDANGATSLVFGRGSLWQHGANNEITLSVGALGADSDNNLFAVLQQGSDNAVNGSISGGGNNQAAVAQLGSSNVVTFSQMGSFNNLGVTQ